MMIFVTAYAQAPTCLWAKNPGNGFDDEGRAIATDVNGNIYIAGAFKSPTIDFGTNVIYNGNGGGDVYNPFLAKYDANGNVLWALNG